MRRHSWGQPANSLFALLAFTVVFTGACGGDEVLRQRIPVPDWTRKGKLAGLAVYAGMSEAQLSHQLNLLVDQHVDVVIADSSLSSYLSDVQFDAELQNVRRVAEAAHARGLKVVWYLTTLEIQTINGRVSPHSMFKDHPDWVQVGYDPATKTFTKPNVFYGAQEDWVDPDDESAWMCPRGPYLPYFLDRVKRIAATGIDGIWADVPLFMDTGAKWACHCEAHQKHFKKVTGLDLPKKIDWKDPVWRRWITYRHEDLNEFLTKIRDAARSVEPAFEVIIEVFTLDYNDAMDKGLDGQFMAPVDGLMKAWEIDSVSNGQGMLHAKPNDWIGKIALTKFARGVDKGRPTWVFCYGNGEWDASMVMGIAFSAQTNPYETKTPSMATSVGAAFRTRMFAWADAQRDAIYDATSAARVGILYSSHSRDYMDHDYGFAMFSDTTAPIVALRDPATGKDLGKRGPDPEWWSTQRRDSVEVLEYLAEYRGFVKVLAHLHVPFAIEGLQHLQLADISRYETLIAPDLAALSDAQAKLLTDYVKGGGHLIVTGSRPTSLDDAGASRAKLALGDILGFDLQTLPTGETITTRQLGFGAVHHINALWARRYLRSNDALALAKLKEIIGGWTSSSLTTDAKKEVYFDLYHYRPKAGDTGAAADAGAVGDGGAAGDAGAASAAKPEELLLHAINLVGYDGKSDRPKATPQKPQVTLELPPDRKVTRVFLSSPDAAVKDQELSFDATKAGLVTFSLPIETYSLARIALAPEAHDGEVTVNIQWPPKASAAPYLAAVVRVSGEGVGTIRVRHAAWGDKSVAFHKLPPGAKVFRVSTLDAAGRDVGLLTRGVDLPSKGKTSISLALGISSGGPTTLEAERGDKIFWVNDTVGPLDLIIKGGAKQSLGPKTTQSFSCDTLDSVPFSLASVTGSVTVREPALSPFAPKVDKVSAKEGYAGHAVTFTGTGFGFEAGSVTWGDAACIVTSWSNEKVSTYLPDGAKPATKDLVLRAAGMLSKPFPFTVKAPEFQPSASMAATFNFVRDHMRAPTGGVYTNYKDRVDPPDAAAVYPYGHHQTGEHMGLILWTSAAMLDHKTFEESFQFVMQKMMSPKRDIVNWAINKNDGLPMRQREDKNSPWLNFNAPLDDFRILKGFISGWMQWKDERYRAAALRLGRGLYETSVSKATDLPKYPKGVVAYAYNWPEDGGLGVTDVSVIPIDYADLWTMKWLATDDPRWLPIIDECVHLMKDSQHATSKQFYNAYLQESRTFSGDFEFRDTKSGQECKMIQTLWVAIHLARIGEKAAAQASLDFLKAFYAKTCGEKFCEKYPCVKQPDHPMHKNCGVLTCRIPEYMHFDGTEIDYCKETYFAHTLAEGEGRIYSQIARLAYYLGGKANTDFADKLIGHHILTDQVTQARINADPELKKVAGVETLIGAIGIPAAKDGDAEAWNNLESLLGLLIQEKSSVISPSFSKE